ncbi:hypothetical protein [Shimia sp. MIT1388]|uniref:hypothetical protein n=1 Tax=Shimia sp. MIT1388 TaxID=3096992 RepID=UPI00399BE6C4
MIDANGANIKAKPVEKRGLNPFGPRRKTQKGAKSGALTEHLFSGSNSLAARLFHKAFADHNRICFDHRHLHIAAFPVNDSYYQRKGPSDLHRLGLSVFGCAMTYTYRPATQVYLVIK